MPERTTRDPLWLPSADVACIDEGAKPVQCPTEAALLPISPLTWTAMIFGVATFNSAHDEDFLREASRTMFSMTHGADVLLVTDLDDPRDDRRIAHLVAVEGVASHVHRCPVCCAGGHVPPGRSVAPAVVANGPTDGSACVGVREAWLARSKVLHMIAEAARRFVDERKRYFMKLDPDTVVHPLNLMGLLTDLSSLSVDAQPLLLGLAACRSEALPSLCHAAGGAGYVLSWPSVAALAAFVERQYGDEWLAQLDATTYGGEDVAVALALHRETGAVVINSGAFHQHRPDEYLYGRMDGIVWPRVRPISFHNFKAVAQYRRFFKCALFSHTSGGWQPRCFQPSADAYVRLSRCASFLPDDESCNERLPNMTTINPHSRKGFRIKPRRRTSDTHATGPSSPLRAEASAHTRSRAGRAVR